jgi:hypothetical protein
VEWLDDDHRVQQLEMDSLVESDSEEQDEEAEQILLENSILSLPSLLAEGEIERLGIQGLSEEIELQKGQVNEALESLRLTLGEKALHLRTNVHNARSQQKSLKAWDRVRKLGQDVRRHRKSYLLA